jgi:hypothetical protein
MDDPRDPLLDPEEDPRVSDALGAITSALTTAPDDLTAQRHRRAIANARRTQPLVIAQRAAATGAVAAGLVVALAVGGVLPDPAQQVAADVASRVGIELPRPAGDEVPPLDTDVRRPAAPDADEDADSTGPGSEGAQRGLPDADGAGVSGTDPGEARDTSDDGTTPPASPTPPAATPAPSPLPVPAEGSTPPPASPPPASTPAPDQRPGSTPDADRPSPAPSPSRPSNPGDEGAAPRDEEGRADSAGRPGRAHRRAGRRARRATSPSVTDAHAECAGRTGERPPPPPPGPRR